MLGLSSRRGLSVAGLDELLPLPRPNLLLPTDCMVKPIPDSVHAIRTFAARVYAKRFLYFLELVVRSREETALLKSP